MYDMPWLSFLAAEGILEDISDKMKEMDLELFFPGALKYYSMFNGRYFGIPFMYAPQVLFIEKICLKMLRSKRVRKAKQYFTATTGYIERI